MAKLQWHHVAEERVGVHFLELGCAESASGTWLTIDQDGGVPWLLAAS
ncbi:hypothetical protein [Streptomyces sp. NPDC005141]